MSRIGSCVLLFAAALFLPACSCVATPPPPRFYNLEEMPKVDVHVHIRGGEWKGWDSYFSSINKVGTTIAVNLSGDKYCLTNAVEIRTRYNDRLQFAVHSGRLANGLWYTADDLETFRKLGAAGCKWAVGWQEEFDRPEIVSIIRKQGEVGLPVFGYHIGTVPSGSTDIDKFWDFNRRAIKVVEACPDTTFIMAHAFFMMGDNHTLDVLDGHLAKHPNLYLDLGAAEQFWTHPNPDHNKVRNFLIKWKDRVLWATDGAVEMSVNPCLYNNFYRILETGQKRLNGYFGGDRIEIDGMNLPLDVLNYIYWWNAARLIPRVKESLLANGYEIDENAPWDPPPAIVKTSVAPSADGTRTKIIVTTDKPALIRWSLSEKRYALMDKEKQFTDGEGTKEHSVEITPAPGVNTIYVSARNKTGMEMPTAVPVAFEDNRVVAYAAPYDKPDGYKLVCRERGKADPGFGLKNMKDPFREAYVRFEAKSGTGNVLQFRHAPNPAYAAEESVTLSISDGKLETEFQVERNRSLDGTAPSNGWHKYAVRLNLDKNVWSVEIDGKKTVESLDQDLATSWGDGFDAITFGLETKDIMVVTGYGAARFVDDGKDDTTPPQTTWLYPVAGDKTVRDDAPVIVEVADPGIGIGPGSIRMSVGGAPVEPAVLGSSFRQVLVYKAPDSLKTGEPVRVSVAASDIWMPPNAMRETTMEFTAVKGTTGGSKTNLALQAPVNVDSLYDRSYDTKMLTDGVVLADPGKGNTWASKDVPSTQPHWVELDLGVEKSVQRARIHWAMNNNLYMTSRVILVQIPDGDGWRTVGAHYAGTPEAATTFDFTPVTASKVRLLQPDFMGPETYKGVMWISEIELY